MVVVAVVVGDVVGIVVVAVVVGDVVGIVVVAVVVGDVVGMVVVAVVVGDVVGVVVGIPVIARFTVLNPPAVKVEVCGALYPFIKNSTVMTQPHSSSSVIHPLIPS